jgi:hypothetical protein
MQVREHLGLTHQLSKLEAAAEYAKWHRQRDLALMQGSSTPQVSHAGKATRGLTQVVVVVRTAAAYMQARHACTASDWGLHVVM